jgi:hypothetical protein
MIPRSGKIHVSKAALTSPGRATQMMNRPSLGKIPANIANRHPIVASYLATEPPSIIASVERWHLIPDG